jgi:hypothetical protein
VGVYGSTTRGFSEEVSGGELGMIPATAKSAAMAKSFMTIVNRTV